MVPINNIPTNSANQQYIFIVSDNGLNNGIIWTSDDIICWLKYA